jgi:hypothetical protein
VLDLARVTALPARAQDEERSALEIGVEPESPELEPVVERSA